MTTNDLAEVLIDLLADTVLVDNEGDDVDVASVRTFADANLLTHNDGVVVTLGDGSSFQLSIVKTRGVDGR